MTTAPQMLKLYRQNSAELEQAKREFDRMPLLDRIELLFYMGMHQGIAINQLNAGLPADGGAVPVTPQPDNGIKF